MLIRTKARLVDDGKLGASTHQVSVLVKDEGHQSEYTSDERQNETSVLTSDIVEELRCEKRRDGTKRVSHETLASDGRR